MGEFLAVFLRRIVYCPGSGFELLSTSVVKVVHDSSGKNNRDLTQAGRQRDDGGY